MNWWLKSMFILLAGGVLIAGTRAAPHRGQSGGRTALGARGNPCTLVPLQRQRLTFPDGSAAYVNVESAAFNGSSMLVAGMPTYHWPFGRVPDDTLFGVLVDSVGRVHPVPQPWEVDGAAFPRVATARHGGWHAVFVRRTPGTSLGSYGVADSADLWYGRFDGRTWHDVTKVQRLRYASIAATLSSRLVTDGDAVAFAYAFDGSGWHGSTYTPHGAKGIVLVRGSPSKWTFDTLRTQFAPSYVRIATSRQAGVIQVAMVQAYFDQRSVPRASSVFVATVDSEWSKPRLVAGDGRHPLTRPHLLSTVAGTVITWRADGTPPRIEQRLLSADTVIGPMSTVLDSAASFAAISLHGMGVLWLARGGVARDQMRAALLKDGHLIDLGALRVQNQALTTQAVAVSRTDVVLFATELVSQGNQPPSMGLTFLNRFAVRCQQPG